MSVKMAAMVEDFREFEETDERANGIYRAGREERVMELGVVSEDMVVNKFGNQEHCLVE